MHRARDELRGGWFDAFAWRPRPDAARILRAQVADGGDRVRALLASRRSTELGVDDIRSVVESNLWMLGPEAFRYFLPALLDASLRSYSSLSIFASELVGALTEPSRGDVEEALDRVGQAAALPPGTFEQLREQQLEWVDSGGPLAIFRERVDGLTDREGAAVLAFFDAFALAHGADFPFGELEIAVARHWSRYRSA